MAITQSEIVSVDEQKLAERLDASDRVVAVSESFSFEHDGRAIAFMLIAVDSRKLEQLKIVLEQTVTLAESYVIEDDADYELAFSMRQEYTAQIDAFVELFKESKDLAFKTHRSLTGLEKICVTPFQTADGIMERKRIQYKNAQAIARERERQENERKLKEQQDRELAAEAERLEKSGDKEAAEEVREVAKTLPAPSLPVQPAVAKQAGAVTKKPWLFEITNADLIPRQYLIPDTVAIGKVVRALGDKANIPGVRAYQDEREGVRR